MIKFFRKIRYDLIGKNKTGKYLKYAIGEIILVVIGILLALQINNWNEKRLIKNSIVNYYERIHDELTTTIPDIIYFNKVIDTLITANSRSLYILNLKDRDSLDLLKHTIGALGTAFKTRATFPIIEEFLNEGNLARIQNAEIKVQFQKFGVWKTRLNSQDDYIDSQYATSIEPFFYDKINYAEIAFDSNKDEFIAGGPETDYRQFYDDMEVWNVLTFKLETLISHSRGLNRFTDYLKTLDSLIVTEIDAFRE